VDGARVLACTQRVEMLDALGADTIAAQSSGALPPHAHATSHHSDSTCPLATRRAVGACLLSALQHTCVPERRVFWHAGPLWNSGRLFLCPNRASGTV
jgi:hypothetical protein